MSSLLRLGVGEANEISPVGKYLRCGRRVIRFRSQTQRGEPAPLEASQINGQRESAPAGHSGFQCIHNSQFHKVLYNMVKALQKKVIKVLSEELNKYTVTAYI